MRQRSGFGWLELAIGILLIVLGVWMFSNPGLALTTLVFAYGIAASIMGIADILLYIQIDRFTGFGPITSMISGILSVMSGIMLLAYPKAGVLMLTLLFPIWFISHCISRLFNMAHIRFVSGKKIYIFMLITNIIGLILGFMMLFRPLFTLTIIRYIACAYLVLLGIDGVVMALSRMGMKR